MPPIHNKNQRNSLEIKRKIELAIIALKNKEISSICKAARLYNISCFTLTYQLKNCSLCMILHTNSHQLTEAEEKILVQ